MKNKKLGIVIIIVGIIILLYPILSDLLFDHNHSVAITQYKEKISIMDGENLNKQKEENKKYNQQLLNAEDAQIISAGENTVEKEGISYINLLNVGEVLGYVEVPRIDINLPIYHGISKNVLESGVGHMPNTSLPTGEVGTHCVLAAHSGLVRAKLFDDIDKMVEGDVFFVSTLNEKFAYKVDQIKVVKPEETKYIEIDEEKDYVTLLTCVPYGINSHRLLVRGSAISIEDAQKILETNTEDKIEEKTSATDLDDDIIKSNSIIKVVKKVAYAMTGVVIIVITIFMVREIINDKKKTKKIRLLKNTNRK